MIIEQKGTGFVISRKELLRWLDLTASGQVLSLDSFGTEIDAFGGSVTHMTPQGAGLLAGAIRAGLVNGAAVDDTGRDHEEFAQAVNAACEEEAALERFEADRRAKIRAA